MCFRKYIFLSFLFLVIIVSNGQSQWCKTTHHSNANSLSSNPNGQSIDSPVTLRVYFHVINDSNGNGGQSEFEVEESFRLINEVFNLYNIFFSWDCTINSINDDFLFNNNTDMGFRVEVNNLDGIDIILYPDHKEFRGFAGGIGGATEFYVSGTEPESGIPMTPSHGITHELGHILNLPHTFGLCENVEAPDNSEWMTLGDGIEDTPPDPGIGRNIDGCPMPNGGGCIWSGEQDIYCNDQLTSVQLSDYDPDTRNYMSYTLLCCMNKFSAGQVEVMRNHIGSSPDISPTIIPDVFKVEGSITINTPTVIHSNILVKQGSILTITSELNMLREKRIFVERGAVLRLLSTSRIFSSCGKWGGIYLQGGSGSQNLNTSFVLGSESPALLVADGAIIQDATTLVRQHALNQNGQIYRGGTIQASNVTFQNCDRGVEMMRFDGDDLSYFRGCTFNTDRYGMSIWRNNDVEISNCEFNNSDYGIVTVNSSVQVSNDCRFTGCNEYGIRLQGTHPNGLDIPSNITNSYFYNNGNDIKMTGVTANMRAQISNNDFIGSTVPTWMDGDNYFNIMNNDFINNGFSNIVYSAGDLPNFHTNNRINSTYYGILAMYQNPGYQFERNCFESSNSADVFVHGGQISSQGTQILGNGNCFTVSTATRDIDTNFNTSFTYFHTEQGTSPACETPTNDANYTTDISLNSKGSENCGNSTLPPLPPTKDLCHPEKDIDSIKVSIKILKEEAKALRSIPEKEQEKPEVIKAELDEKDQCIRKLILLLSDLLEDEDIDEAIKVLKEERAFRYDVMAYGLMIRSGRLTDAQNFLYTMERTSQEQQDFVFVQNIVIRDIIGGRKGFMNDAESSRIYDIAHKNDPMAAYARSLWYWYTGEDIVLDLPELKGTEAIKPRSNAAGSAEKWNIYPNPSDGSININVDGIESKDQYHDVSIIDVDGKIRYSNRINVSKLQQINIELPSGIYILTIANKEEIIHSQRIVIAK